MTMIRGYLIDPLALTITPVEMESDDYKAINGFIDAQTFDAARIGPSGDAIFVDDEGLLVPQPPNNFFLCSDYPTPLAGKGLVLGSDAEGNSTSPRISLDALIANTFGVTLLGGGTVMIYSPMTKGETSL